MLYYFQRDLQSHKLYFGHSERLSTYLIQHKLAQRPLLIGKKGRDDSQYDVSVVMFCRSVLHRELSDEWRE